MKESNARVELSFYSDDYPDVNLTFYCSEDLSIQELNNFFARFAAAMGYASKSIEDVIGEEVW